MVRTRTRYERIARARAPPRRLADQAGAGPTPLGQGRLPVRPAQGPLELAGEERGLRHRPGRVQPGVDQDEPVLGVQQRAVPQPVEQLVAIRRGQHLVERVALLGGRDPGGAGQQVQVVIAEHHRGGVTEVAGPAQHVERAWAAVDQIADQPQVIGPGPELDALEQPVEAGLAALQVADAVARHQTATTSSRNPMRTAPTRRCSAPVPRTR